MLLAVLAFVWQQHFGGPNSGDHVNTKAVAVDTSGNAFSVGSFTSSAAGISFGGAALVATGVSEDIFITKFTSAGAYAWSKRFGSSGTDVGYGVGTDSSGNVYITGQFQGTVDFGGGNLVAANADIFVLKLDSAGNYVWQKQLTGTGNDLAYAISVNSSGTFVISGEFGSFGGGVNFGGGVLTSAGSSDIFVAEYDSSGTYVWAKQIGGSGTDRGFAVAIDSTGVAAVTGDYRSSVQLGCGSIISNGLADIPVVKFSSTGGITWVRRFGGTSDDRGTGIAIGPSGEVLVTGYFDGTINFGGGVRPDSGGGVDIFLAKYTTNGVWTWDKVFGSPIGVDSPRAVAVDSSGNISMVGDLDNPLDFGCGSFGENSSTNVLITKFTSAGACISSARYGDLSDDHGYGVAFDSSGNLIIGGTYSAGINFGGGQMTSPGGYDGFLVKFSP